jgi:translation elongation factor Ts
MAFTAQDVAALRAKTGCGMMDCKKALTDAEGNEEKAIELLREKGLAAAAKKSGRIAAEGLVTSVIKGDKGVVLEVNSETDFVAKNKDFIKFVADVADVILENEPADVDALLPLTLDGQTIEEALREKILTIGENLKIRRFVILKGALVSYVHGEGKIGVLAQFDTDLAGNDAFTAYGKDVCMQIAAAYPQFLDRSEVSADTLEKEREILLAQAINEGKPKEIAEKMVNGRISKYYSEFCLLEQPFVKEPKITVQNYTDTTAKELGGSIKIAQFVRFEKGEGLEKREDDFAAEVAAMTGK